MIISRTFVVVFILLVASVSSIAQVKKKKKKRKSSTRTEQVAQPTALNPLPKEDAYAPKATKKKSKGPTFESERQFYERMAQLEKTKLKNEKEMQKPQYSDPSYFGHKRPPKRNKPGKMKFCKECGIRH